MLGKDLFKVENNAEISTDRLKCLVLFYTPLIGSNALYLYEYLAINNLNITFEEISSLLNALLISINSFENAMNKLNEYKLVKTLKDETSERYIFVVNSPLTINEFIKDEIFVRNFILKTSGQYYQSLLVNVRYKTTHRGFKDISKKIDPNVLSNWTESDESFLKQASEKKNFDFNSIFDVNKFLADASVSLLPMKYRSEENLKAIASYADMYNISIDKMRTFIPKVAKSDSDSFDLKLLRYLCENAISEYKQIEAGDYNVPNKLFLMNKLNGKEITKFDNQIIYMLANDYHLRVDVVNVLLEHGLNSSNNTLIKKFLEPIANAMYKNNIDTAQKAIKYLEDIKYKNKNDNKKEIKPNFTNIKNPTFDEEEYTRLRKK